MKNSTVKKARGPIRTGALIPSLVVIGLVWAYFFFFFDSHLRAALEFAATRVHGAEVNIASVNTSLRNASFRMEGLQVTDKEQPARNFFQVGEIRLQLLWDALLRAKAVVESAAVLDIRAYTEREKPGYVLPPPPPGESVLGRVQAQVVEQTRKKINDNFLGDIANVLGGVKPEEQLKNIQAELQANVRAEELQKELQAKKEEWEKRLQELPRPKDIKELEGRIKALNLKTKNPLELAQNLKQAKEMLAEAEAKVKLVDQSQENFRTDISSYTQAIAGLEQLAAQDVRDLQKRLQLPSLDPKEFSTQLFLSQVEDRLVSLRKYVALARKYMPPKKSDEKKEAERAEAVVPRARGEGVNFLFPVTSGYPLFWLKKAEISSELTQSEWAGSVRGELTHLTTDPVQLGKPAHLRLQGDFPRQGIAGLDFQATVDHTTARARESLKLSVASFPVLQQMLSGSEDVKFGLSKAVGSGGVEATLADEQLTVGLKSRFQQPDFFLETKNQKLQEVLGAVLKGISLVTMNATVTGSWDSLRIDIDSNLGKELSAGFQRQLEAKVSEAKARLDAFVKEKVEPARRKAKEQLDALAGGPGQKLSQARNEMGDALQSAKGGIPSEGGSPADKAKGLFKGFGL